MIFASILNSDLSNIQLEVARLHEAGVDAFHFDVMDGVFVDNISFGLPILSAFRKVTSLPIDVHLMIQDPIQFADRFAEAGADMISFHIESASDPQKTINRIHSCGIAAGIAVSPDTSISKIYPLLSSLGNKDFVLIMTVYPGLGGQAFIEQMLQKINELQQYKIRNGLNFHIEVDGGINQNTCAMCRKKGADLFVVGSFITGSADPIGAVALLRD